MQADLNDYEPPQPVQATTIFRAIYYARDRRALFVKIGGYTEEKIVFDLNPRQYSLADVRADLHAAGFDQLDARPFFVPQTRALPGRCARATRPRACATLRGARAPRPVHPPVRGFAPRGSFLKKR